jgi:hypothetical protein
MTVVWDCGRARIGRTTLLADFDPNVSHERRELVTRRIE